jgi:hypothetical protein
MLGFVIAGVPALLVCTLLWLGCTASNAARTRAHAKPSDYPGSPL